MSRTQKDICWGQRSMASTLRRYARTILRSYRAKLLNGYCKFIGKWGERQASRYLATSGVWLIRRNWRNRRLESDIIGIKGRSLLIIEVKTRRHQHARTYSALSAFTPHKEKRLHKLAHAFRRSESVNLRRFAIKGTRIDLVEVYFQLSYFCWPKVVTLHHREGMSLQ